MSVLRVTVLLVVVACLVVFVRGQADPTSFCYNPEPSADGGWISDVGFWDLIGLQSTYSSQYTVLCAFRGLYLQGPAGSNVQQFGPWHGNASDLNCGSPLLTQYAKSTERGNPSSGAFTTRTNAATGGSILGSFRIVGTCNNSASNAICAGLCYGIGNYDAELADAQADPTYQEYTFTPTPLQASPYGPAAVPYVVTTLNSTQYPNGPVTMKNSPYLTANVSAITSVQKCTGMETLAC